MAHSPESDVQVRRKAVLLLGPTGSGKTPFGQYLAEHGLAGRPCVHFDFGEQLRSVEGGALAGHVSEQARGIVHRSLATGALLEDHEFFVVGEIMDAFVAIQGLPEDGLVVLNGMPRHVGQAESCAQMLDVVRVIVLECTPATVHARIAQDRGGDRAGRQDDDVALVEKKLAIYDERTRPLRAFYEADGVPVSVLQVGERTQPADLADLLQKEYDDDIAG